MCLGTRFGRASLRRQRCTACGDPLAFVELAAVTEAGSPGAEFDSTRLGRRDNNFAEGASFTDVCKCGGNLVEGEGAVDVDPYLACSAEGGERLEVRGALLHGEHSD
jgi:hypothetical protein